MNITFSNMTVECPQTPMAFDREDFGKLLAIKVRLAEQKALTPNERDLAVSMETVLHSAVRLDRLDESLDTLAVPDRPKRNWSRINPKIEIVIAARQAHVCSPPEQDDARGGQPTGGNFGWPGDRRPFYSRPVHRRGA